MYYKFSIYQNNIKKRNLQFERFFSFQHQNDSELLNVHVDITVYKLFVKKLKVYKFWECMQAFSFFCILYIINLV